jgi:hypothetical protein
VPEGEALGHAVWQTAKPGEARIELSGGVVAIGALSFDLESRTGEIAINRFEGPPAAVAKLEAALLRAHE